MSGERSAGAGPPAEGLRMTMDLPSVPDIEIVAIEGVNRLAMHLGVGEEKIGEARLLVAEAVINALEHGGTENPVVRVEFTLRSGELVILVRDSGKGFDPASVEDPTIEGKIGAKRKRGWGLKLIRSMSDAFWVESGPEGTTITIRKMLI